MLDLDFEAQASSVVHTIIHIPEVATNTIDSFFFLCAPPVFVQWL